MKKNIIIKLIMISFFLFPLLASAQSSIPTSCEWYAGTISPLSANCEMNGLELSNQSGACVGNGTPLVNPVCCCKPMAKCNWHVKGYAEGGFVAPGSCEENQNQLEKDGSFCDQATKPKVNKSKKEEAVCCCYKEKVQTVETKTEETKKDEPLLFSPQIKIPNSVFSGDNIAVGSDNSKGIMNSDLLAKYIKAVYDYGISIAAILAAIVLMAGGVLWLTSAGSDTKITQAKELIKGSIIGLAVILCSWVILNTINPALLKFKAISTQSLAQTNIRQCCNSADGSKNAINDSKGNPICNTGYALCPAGESCVFSNNRWFTGLVNPEGSTNEYKCAKDNVCCDCRTNCPLIGGLCTSRMCRNDLTEQECNDWCYESANLTWVLNWYVMYNIGGSEKYSCEGLFATNFLGTCLKK